MAVGYWENRLLAKCLFHWLKMPRQLTEAATQCAARSRAKIIRWYAPSRARPAAAAMPQLTPLLECGACWCVLTQSL